MDHGEALTSNLTHDLGISTFVAAVNFIIYGVAILSAVYGKQVEDAGKKGGAGIIFTSLALAAAHWFLAIKNMMYYSGSKIRFLLNSAIPVLSLLKFLWDLVMPNVYPGGSGDGTKDSSEDLLKKD